MCMTLCYWRRKKRVLQGMIGHILHRNRLLKQVIGVGGGGEGRIQREDEEEDISSYWMTLQKREDTGN